MRIVHALAAAAALATASSAVAYKTGYTRDEANAAAVKKFGQMNTDKKGEVSAAELDAFMAKSSAKRGEAHDAAKVARRLKRLDADANGQVSMTELQAEELEKFDKADANRNGVIDASESA